MCRSRRSLSGGDIDGMDNHMSMFEELKRLIYGYKSEPEVWLVINGKEYMMIGYVNNCFFQMCGAKRTGSGEFYYGSFNELCNSITVDGIILKKDLYNITEIFSYDLDILMTHLAYVLTRKKRAANALKA